jgi:hypothetical protein
LNRVDFLDLQELYDRTAIWLRDCCKKGDTLGVSHAEARLKELDTAMAAEESKLL